MTQARSNDLSYGHLGGAIYDTKSARWHFQRVGGIRYCLQPVNDFTTSLGSTLLEPPSSYTQSSTSRREHIKTLSDLEPTLSAAAYLLAPLVQVSEVVSDVTATSDPITSDLLAFGTAADLENKSSGVRTTNVVAVVGGLAGEEVRILQIGKDRYGWGIHKGVQLHLPTIDKTEQVSWAGDRSPVQQVCFHETEHGRPGGWLAIRHLGGISILRPLIHRTTLSANSFDTRRHYQDTTSRSRLDPNLIAELPIYHTGGDLHVDVTFNPWTPRQFAVLDLQGRWSIWDIEGKTRAKSTWTIVPGPSGTLPSFDESGPSIITTDGWGRIMWAGSVASLVIANRNALFIYIVDTTPRQLLGPELKLNDGSEWILDMQRSTVNLGHIFVLTSFFIHWLEVATQEPGDGHPIRQGANVLLSRRHFRNQNDRSLRISISRQQEETVILLYSTTSDLVTVFTFAVERSSNLPQSLSDPFQLPLGNIQEYQTTSWEPAKEPEPKSRLSGLYMNPVEYSISATCDPLEPGNTLLDSGVWFSRLFVLYNNLSISERLYALLAKGQNLQQKHIPQRIHQRAFKTSTLVIEDSFVVPDRFVARDKPGDNSEPLGSRRDASGQISTVTQDGRTIDLQWLVQRIEANIVVEMGRTISGEELADMLVQSVDQVISYENGIKSILELLPNTSLDIVEVASSMLHNFIDGINDGSFLHDINETDEADSDAQLKAFLLLTTSTVHAIFSEALVGDSIQLMPLYRSLFNVWFTSLDREVPSRARVSLEKRLRLIASQLYCSMHGLQRTPRAAEEQRGTVDNDDDEFVLPLRRKGSATSLSRKGKERARDSSPPQPASPFSVSSQPARSRLPTPEATPSLRSEHSTSSTTMTASSPYERLRALTSLDHQQSPPDSVAQLISHWNLGEDPEKYDWAHTESMLNLQRDVGSENSLRIRERLERRLKRQRKESRGALSHPATSKSLSSQTQPAVSPFASSQPKTSQPVGSSSQVAPLLLSAIQTRAVAKKATTPQKRRAGF